jgi:uncharacterized iron-regulated membrane protein
MAGKITGAVEIRRFHRWIAVAAIVFGLFIAVTGITLQLTDLSAILSHAPAADPTMQAIRVGIYGPPNFQVLREEDHAAPGLPSNFDYDAALARGLAQARTTLGARPVGYVELQMTPAGPTGSLGSQGTSYRFDPASGALVGSPTPVVLPPLGTPSTRNSIKAVHRMKAFGDWMILLDAFAGLTILAMIVTGLVLYWRLYQARLKGKRRALFWSAGGLWRRFHRSVALVASLFLMVIATTGTILSISSVGVLLQNGDRQTIYADLSSPLSNAELPAMLHATLTAFRSAHGDAPVKRLRLRYFAGMPQGVVVFGEGEAEQAVYDTHSAREVGFSEPNYPPPGQTFGWQVDETAKEIHRGDYFGLTGRAMSLLSGFALLYISVSGAVMYFELWRRRRQGGRKALFWK